MGKAAAAMLAGALALLALPELPTGYLVAALCAPFSLLALPRQRLHWLLFLPLGFAWCWFVASDHLASRLAPELEGQTLAAAGWVHSIPTVRGQHWEWDGVDFQVLYPDADAPAGGNDASCVLKVSGAGGSALLTGDIMKKSERRLLELDAPMLRSELLVAPHHGSNSSSSAPFVAAVSPMEVLFPVGYRNRWGFPKPEVVARYMGEGAAFADSASDGAVCVQLRPGMRPVVVMRWRPDAARLWTER